tara:strand:+ start:1094 stop:1522 length:429 start_codon:yes stop_codon:yes gene_type:complete
MIYDYDGKPRNLKKLVLEEALAYAKKYLKLSDASYVLIEFTKDCDAFGYAHDEGDHDYHIEINKTYNVSLMLGTLFHELTHIQQYESGRLVITHGEDPDMWEGLLVTAQYDDQPWEQEAFDLEKKMLRNFKRNFKKKYNYAI